ncbi:SagB family peptide dehydrogenase [Streptomyces sp. CA-249302]|uniref:SagB family peptide dehydrogenase n=1 Tax=Streptomyces sp. CA-249302 TaxID=3240058 RepID=UPI003D8F0463
MRIDQLAGSELAELWSLREDVLVEHEEPAAAGEECPAVTLRTRWGGIRIERPGRELAELLRRMTFGPVTPANVVPGFPAVLAMAHAVPPEAKEVVEGLERVAHCVVRTLALGGTPLLSVVPVARDARFAPRPLAPGRARRMSRFAVLRATADGMRLESPLARHRVEVRHPGVGWLIGELGGREGELPGSGPARPFGDEVVEAVHVHLAAAAMVVCADGTGPGAGYPEDGDPSLLAWSPTDLFTHTRSRLGRHDDDFGMTYPLAGRVPAQPPVKPSPGGTAVLLDRPDPVRLGAFDRPFADVLEGRRSTRRLASEGPSLEQLGVLLHRAARVRALLPPAATDPTGGPRTARPYPSAGDSYALEIYLIAARCPGLAPGPYHYDPLGHRLEPVAGDPDAVRDLLAGACTAAGLAEPPPLLVVLTTRMLRLAAQYSAVAYTNALKEVGALQQTFYLTCSAMGLGACALTASDLDAAARALALDWLVEPSVGEIVLGLPDGN